MKIGLIVSLNFISLFGDQVFDRSLPFEEIKSEILCVQSLMKCEVQADGYKHQEPFAG
jgi:hypothetical protein